MTQKGEKQMMIKPIPGKYYPKQKKAELATLISENQNLGKKYYENESFITQR